MGRQVIIVGGGVVGCSVAWHLAALSDCEVTLIERDRLASGTTWHSAGNITWRPGAQHDEMVLYAFEVIHVEQATTLFPVLEKAPIRRFVNGPESFTPDNLPLIGAVKGIDDLYLCTAMNSGGVTYSAGAGGIIADLVGGVPPRFATRPFLPHRFGEKAQDIEWLKREVSEVVSRGYRKTNL